MAARSLSLSLAAALLVGACGGDDAPSNEEQVATNVNAWTEALAAGDGEGACQLMTEGGRIAMTDPYDGLGPDRPPLASTCEAAVPKLVDDQERDAVAQSDVTPTDVTVQGDRAVVQPEGGFCTYLQRVDDQWLVVNLPLPGPDDPDSSGEIPDCQPKEAPASDE